MASSELFFVFYMNNKKARFTCMDTTNVNSKDHYSLKWYLANTVPPCCFGCAVLTAN